MLVFGVAEFDALFTCWQCMIFLMFLLQSDLLQTVSLSLSLTFSIVDCVYMCNWNLVIHLVTVYILYVSGSVCKGFTIGPFFHMRHINLSLMNQYFIMKRKQQALPFSFSLWSNQIEFVGISKKITLKMGLTLDLE